jgi:hypothetical protein
LCDLSAVRIVLLQDVSNHHSIELVIGKLIDELPHSRSIEFNQILIGKWLKILSL